MEIYHKTEIVEGINTLVLHVNYPSEYEFGLDFNSIKKQVATFTDKIREYAMKTMDKVQDNNVLLILNGVVMGSLMVSQILTPNLTKKH
ncbi:MAG: hypothetical protein RSE00_05090 [Clostridia bacterium]